MRCTVCSHKQSEHADDQPGAVVIVMDATDTSCRVPACSCTRFTLELEPRPRRSAADWEARLGAMRGAAIEQLEIGRLERDDFASITTTSPEHLAAIEPIATYALQHLPPSALAGIVAGMLYHDAGGDVAAARARINTIAALLRKSRERLRR